MKRPELLFEAPAFFLCPSDENVFLIWSVTHGVARVTRGFNSWHGKFEYARIVFYAVYCVKKSMAEGFDVFDRMVFSVHDVQGIECA